MPESLEWVCGLCGRLLDKHTVREGGRLVSTEWRHQIGDEQRSDHEVLPVQVPVTQAHLRCDFCHDDVSVYGAHRLLTADVVIVAPGAGPGGMDESVHMGEDWLADAPCAELIRAGRWQDLFRRGLAGYERRHVQPVSGEAKVFMKLIYNEVERCMVRIDPPPTPPKEAP